MAKAPIWTQADLDLVKANLDMPSDQLASLFPGRSASACNNIRYRYKTADPKLSRVQREVPPVKPAGDYVETLSCVLTDDFECLGIWLKWQGYASSRELSRDTRVGAFGIATLLCTAK